MHIIDLRVIQPMMTGNQNTTPRHGVGMRVTFRASDALDTLECRLAQNIAREHNARLNVALFEEDLKLGASKGSALLHGKWKGEPAGVRLSQLVREYEPLIIVGEETPVPREMNFAAGDVTIQLVQLHESERSPHLGRFEIVTKFLEHELGIIRYVAKSYIEAIGNTFGIVKHRGGAPPRTQQKSPTRERMIVDAQHATISGGIDHV